MLAGEDLWRARRNALVWTALTVLLLWQGLIHVLLVALPDSPGQLPADVRMQARWVGSKLSGDSVPLTSAVFPEGDLFTWQFYGLALQNLADTTHDPADLEHAQREVKRLLPLIDGLLARKPYSNFEGRKLKGGIVWFSGQNLLRGRMVAQAVEPDAADVERFKADSALLHSLFMASPTGVLEAHPEKTWPVDSLFGLESLRIHDELYGTKYAAQAYARWKGTVKRAEDKDTRLMPSFVHLDGRARDVPRGCALSWSLAVMPSLDASPYVKDQWRHYQAHFGGCFAGLCLFREWLPGSDRRMDPDSGPIVAGFGMAASGFALAAARAMGDGEWSGSLRRTGELLGFPGVTLWGKRYLGGWVPTLDVFALWVRTVPFRGDEREGFHPIPPLLIALVWLFPARAAFRRARRAREKLVFPNKTGSAAQKGLFFAAVAVLVLHVLWPILPLLVAMTLLGLIQGIGRFAPAKVDDLASKGP